MSKTKTINYLTIFALVSIILATVYMVVRQVYSSHAKEPQVQLAYNLKAHLEQNKPLDYLLAPDSIDLRKSPQTFITLFDSTGKPLHTMGYLNNKLPLLTKRASDLVKRKEEDCNTWHSEYEWPSIILPVDHSAINFLLVGSLKETGETESKLSSTVLIAWIACVLTVLFSGLLTSIMEKRNNEI